MAMEQHHFLIVTYPVQGHINPGLHLANRLSATVGGGGLVTFSTAVSAHHRKFPNVKSEVCVGNLTFLPYPDDPDADKFTSILNDLAAGGRRVTCVIFTLLLPWVVDAAHQLGIPCAQYWIQPAATFLCYFHYFHHYNALIDSHKHDPFFSLKLPGLPQMQIRDLPSFIVKVTSEEDPDSKILPMFKESFERLDKDMAEHRPKILVNTFDELEPDAVRAIDGLDLIGIGPVLPSIFDKKEEAAASGGFDIFKSDKQKQYLNNWLDSKLEKSVVYVSFGSISVLKKQQLEEIQKGLKSSGRPYLWVVREDSRYEGFEEEEEEDEDGGDEEGMIVEWCSQVSVLMHRSVGCFVTHCGWNSTLESLTCGVPTVGVPQWADQGTNVMLMEKEWGTGVRSEVNEEGVLESDELLRCLDLVMGDGERGEEIRRNAEVWKGKVREAVSEEEGSSYRNFKAFIEELASS